MTKQKQLRSLGLTALGACLPLLLGPFCASAQTSGASSDDALTGYTLTDVGKGSGDGGAVALNDRCQVAGTDGHAFLWADGKRTDLGTLKPEDDEISTTADPYGINSQGVIVGSSGSFDLGFGDQVRSRGFIVKNGVMRQWTDQRVSFTPCAINDAGEIVGEDGVVGFVYLGGKMTYLQTLSNRPGGNRGTARSISQSGLVVGWSTINSKVHDPQTGSQFGLLPVHAFLWQRGTGKKRRNAERQSAGRMRDLGTLPGCVDSYGYAVNRRGEVVGSATHGKSEFEGVAVRDVAAAFLWRGGKMTALAKLPGRKNCEAFAINDSSTIAGSCDSRAVIWSRGKIVDLNTFLPPASGWFLEEAQAINNRGQIVGSGIFQGEPHLFLLTPTTTR